MPSCAVIVLESCHDVTIILKPQCCLPSGVDIVLKADVSPDDRHPRTYTVVLTGEAESAGSGHHNG